MSADLGNQVPSSSGGVTDFPRCLPFDPTMGSDGEAVVGDGWVRLGRKVWPVESSDKVIEVDKLLYLEVTHPTSATAEPTFALTFGDDCPDNTSDKTYVPLYRIEKGGFISEDYRLVPTVPLYE